LTLVFEDAIISYLRHKTKLVTASRNDITRIGFCVRLARMVNTVHIPVFAPEAKRKIKIEKFDKSDEGRLAGRQSGIAAGEDLTVKGAAATKTQTKNIQAVLDQCVVDGVSRKLQIVTVMTVIGEDAAHNSKMATAQKIDQDGLPITIPTNDGSVGMFQQRASMGWPATRNIAKDTHAFLKGVPSKGVRGAIEVEGDDPDTELWEVCANVQHPRADLRESTYEPWTAEATAWVDSYNPGEINSDRTFVGRYMYSTRNDDGEIEDFWTTIKRLMDELQMAAFAQQGMLWLVREAYLTSSMPAQVVDPDDDGIDDIDYDWNVNKEDATAIIYCQASRWTAPAGTSVKLRGLGFDKQRWLVDTIGRSALDPATTISLRTAQHSLPEPASQLITVSVGDRGGDIGGSDVNGLPDAIAAAYREAQKIDRKHYPYAWGGGHEHAGTPSRHSESSGGGRIVLGYDCSGSTGAVLAAAEPLVKGSKGFGLPKKGDNVIVSGEFGSYGVYGEGRYMTWWYNGEHVFLEFKRPSNRDSDGKMKVEHFGTGRWGKDWSGAGFNDELHPHDGFQPGHIPGM
jgi:hypothetical protein